MTIALRPHQQRGLDALLQNAIGQVIVPTGGGKTLIGILDAQRRSVSYTHLTLPTTD